jgi:hypothetical protein
MEAYLKLVMRGYLVELEIGKFIKFFKECFDNFGIVLELMVDMRQSMTADMMSIKRLVSMISSPRKVAQSLGTVKDGAPALVKYTVTGYRRGVYCTKHCGPKSIYTRGYSYAFYDADKKPAVTEPLCEKCVRELSDKRERGRLARLMGMKREPDSRSGRPVHDQKPKPQTETQSPKRDHAKSIPTPQPKVDVISTPILEEVGAPKRPDVKSLEQLSEMTVKELRVLAKANGISPIPTRKQALLTALMG